MCNLIIYLLTADGPAVEGLELEVQLGPRAAKKLLKEISFADTKTPKVKAVLQKLRKVLEGEKMNKNSSFFSHNKLFYSQSTSSHSFSSSSSVRSSKSHLSKVSIFITTKLIPGFSIYYATHTLNNFQSHWIAVFTLHDRLSSLMSVKTLHITGLGLQTNI